MSVEGARVLVVEDEEAIAAGLALNLERKGCRVEVVGDGRSALARAAAGGWDLSSSTCGCRRSTASRCASGCGRATT